MKKLVMRIKATMDEDAVTIRHEQTVPSLTRAVEAVTDFVSANGRDFIQSRDVRFHVLDTDGVGGGRVFDIAIDFNRKGQPVLGEPRDWENGETESLFADE